MDNFTKLISSKLLFFKELKIKNLGLKLSLLSLITVSFLFQVRAQAPQFATGTTNAPSNSFPFNSTGGKSLQSLILPGELTGAYFGNITKVYFQGTASSSGTYNGLTIKMGQPSTSTTTLPTGAFATGLTTVFAGTSTTLSTTTAGWASLTLQTPFLYDPSKSLIIEIQQCSSTGGFTITNVSKTGFRRTWNASGCNTTYS